MTTNETSRSAVLVDIAENALRYWAGADVSREKAAALLPTWPHAVALTDAERTQVLDRFKPTPPVRWRDEDGDIWREVNGGLLARELGDRHTLGVRSYPRNMVDSSHGPLTRVLDGAR